MKIKIKPIVKRYRLQLDISDDELYTLLSLTEFMSRGPGVGGVTQKEADLASNLNAALAEVTR